MAVAAPLGLIPLGVLVALCAGWSAVAIWALARRGVAMVTPGDHGVTAVLVAAPVPMWWRGDDGALVAVNAAYAAAVGAADAPAAVAQALELVDPADQAAARAVAVQAAGQGITRQVIVTLAGQRRAAVVVEVPISGGVLGWLHDVEAGEQHARDLRQLRGAQRQMVDRLSAAMAQFDSAMKLQFANAAFVRIFGLANDWLADQPGFDRVLDRLRELGRLPAMRDYPAWRRERQDWFQRRDAAEEAWHLSDGTHLRVVAQPLPEGGLVLLCEDRTAELRLAAAQDTLLRTRAATFDHLAEALAVFGPDSRLALWNRRFADWFALDEALLLTHPRLPALEPLLARALAEPASVARLGEVVGAATLVRVPRHDALALADGRQLALAGVPLPDGNGLLTLLDVTDAHKAETALRERNAALLEADAVKTRVLATVSYELRTPLTTIAGFAEMLDSGLAGPLGETATGYVAAIREAAARLEHMIDTVLDLSAGEAGLLPLAREPVALGELVREVVALRRGPAEAGGVALALDGDDAAALLTGDSRRLARALGQLLDNALAATAPGGQITVALAVEDTQAHVTISDTGKGMTPTVLARALEGLRVGADGTTLDQRQGLGLPMVRQVIAAHGGQFDLVSEPGQGTTAMVTLPLEPAT